MTSYLTVEQTLAVAGRAVGGPVAVRDRGLLDAAVHRPRAVVSGQDVYPDLFTKAAALLHALVTFRPLLAGNERLAWLATYVFCARNGVELDAVDVDAYDLVMAVAAGDLDDVTIIAARLAYVARAA